MAVANVLSGENILTGQSRGLRRRLVSGASSNGPSWWDQVRRGHVLGSAGLGNSEPAYGLGSYTTKILDCGPRPNQKRRSEGPPDDQSGRQTNDPIQARSLDEVSPSWAVVDIALSGLGLCPFR